MKVAVLEYLSGGGLATSPAMPVSEADALFSPLLREGLCMLSALAIDLVHCGHEVHVCLAEVAAETDMGRSLRELAPDLRVHAPNEAWNQKWKEIAVQCERTIVIAPELHQELQRIVAELRRAGASVIASSDSLLHVTSDKLATAKLIQAAQIRHPLTQTVAEASSRSSPNFSIPSALLPIGPASTSNPLVLKRRDGAGCADMKYFPNEIALNQWLASMAYSEWQADQWIVQHWQPGVAASLVVIADEEWHLVGAMSQTIRFNHVVNNSGAANCSDVFYLGGEGPLQCVTKDQLNQWLERIRGALPSGAYGWIGIDFIVPPAGSESAELVFIEVNPRLTTSYLGYRKWYGHKLAECMLGVAGLGILHGIDFQTMDRIAFEAN